MKRLAAGRDVVLLDFTTNGDVANTAQPLSHAALIKHYVEGTWPGEGPAS